MILFGVTKSNIRRGISNSRGKSREAYKDFFVARGPFLETVDNLSSLKTIVCAQYSLTKTSFVIYFEIEKSSHNCIGNFE